MSKLLKWLCGKNLGIVEDEPASPENSDDEGSQADSEKDKYMPKDHKKAKKLPGGGLASFTKKGVPKLDGVGGGGWLMYRTTVTERATGSGPVQHRPAIKAYRGKITSDMMKKLSDMVEIHTIDITQSHLKECPHIMDMDNLVFLRLSHNDIPYLTAAENGSNMTKESKMETFICDWNKIQALEPGCMSYGCVANLEVLNLAHNEIGFLPRDFLLNGKRLRYLDLSYNKLTTLPDTITTCKKLELLHIPHNALTSLPEGMSELKLLRKLYASYNRLKALPEDIGDCRSLEKIRLLENKLTKLPHSMIALWESKVLSELLIEGNPLEQPSITAFQMGANAQEGLDRAFDLFRKEVAEEKRLAAMEAQQALQDQEDTTQLALPSGHEDRLVGRSGSEGIDFSSRATIADFAQVGASTAEDLALLSDKAEISAMAGVGGDPRHEDELNDVEAEGNLAVAEDVLLGARSLEQEAAKAKMVEREKYYFSHMEGDDRASEVQKIRGAESGLLLQKRQMYIDGQMKQALEAARSQKQGLRKEIPEHLAQFLQPGFNPGQDYKDKIRVTDLDLYFILLVFSTKSMFTTCEALFDKYEAMTKNKYPSLAKGENPKNSERHLTKEEWDDMCSRVPIKLPLEVQEDIWKLLTFQAKNVLPLTEFVAGWHIHDIEDRDPYIARVAKVLMLDFYDMDVEEMRSRLKAKGAEDANQKMGFDEESSGSETEKDGIVQLPQLEGERRYQNTRTETVKHAEGKAEVAKEPTKVSMTDTQYAALASDDDEEGGDSGNSMTSGALSRGTDSSRESFDAQEYLEAQFGSSSSEGEEEQDDANARLLVDSDEAMLQLMKLSTKEILKSNASANKMKKARQAVDKKKKKKKKKVAGGGSKKRNHRYKTDVFEVRRSLREAYRNLPMADFSHLVNFILRNLKQINNSPEGTFWHTKEPSFRHAMGQGRMNSYAKKLLEGMGFVQVHGVYWAWPIVHLIKPGDVKPGKTGEVLPDAAWVNDFVPLDCPGRDEARLVDMINLFQACQRTVITSSETFTGHFPD